MACWGMASADEHCPPPAGLTAVGLLTLLGLSARGETLRRRVARALHDRAPAQWPETDDGPARFGERLLGFLADAEGDRAFAETAAAIEADIAPAGRRLDVLAAARRHALRVLEETAPDAAARLLAAHRPGEPPALALAEAAAEAGLWTEAALILWRLAGARGQEEDAARLAARYPHLADALPALARRAPRGQTAVPPGARGRLLRLMGLAEDPDTATLLPPPGARVESRLAALPPERVRDLPPGWRDSVRRLGEAEAATLGQALDVFERAALVYEARETALREAALQAELDLIAVEAALAAARAAEASRNRAWREVVAAVASSG
jgi:hypothetical protein